jgi:sugar/nucleoside kinase (ribokinase family)
MYKVVSLGDLVVDVVVAIPQLPVHAGHHQIVRDLRIEPGGAGNFLIAGSRIGMSMAALGTIGADIYGTAVIDILKDEGIDIEGVIQETGSSSTIVLVLVDDQGRHVFLGGYGIGPVISVPDPWHDKLNQADAVFGCGYTLQEERLSDAAIYSMHYARQRGIPVFFDPGPEMERATPSQVNSVLNSSHVLLLTEEEIPLMCEGREGIQEAALLLQHGLEMVCVKRGENGCVVLHENGVINVDGLKVPARDTTAAGDSFAAAFIYAYLNKWQIEEIAEFANAMGAAKVMKVGSGRNVPAANELREVLKEHQINIPF